MDYILANKEIEKINDGSEMKLVKKLVFVVLAMIVCAALLISLLLI